MFRSLLIGGHRLYHCLYPPPADWGLPASLVRVVPHPIESHHSQRRASRHQRFLFVGRLNRDKGADLLCELANRLTAEPDTEVVVVGEGEYASEIRACAGVKYFRQRDDVRLLMRDATWLLMPSRWEQQPLVLLEALGEQLPYILGPAAETRRFALENELTMSTDSADAIYSCCVAALERGRSATGYQRTVDRVVAIAAAWPTPSETNRAMVSLFAEAASLPSH